MALFMYSNVYPDNVAFRFQLVYNLCKSLCVYPHSFPPPCCVVAVFPCNRFVALYLAGADIFAIARFYLKM